MLNNTRETWLPVVGYEGMYSVSNLGNIMSMNFARTGMLKLLTPGLSRKSGYLRVTLYRGATAKTFFVHRIVAAAFLGERNGRQVNHKSGIKADNSEHNLEYCTASENRKHAFRIGLQSSKGEAHSQSRLTEANVIDIKTRIADGERQNSIAKIYNVDPSVISKVAGGRAWGHVNNDKKVG